MTLEIIVPPVLCLLLGYLLGSVPFGLLLTRAAGLGDVRDIGSGNIGATNVLQDRPQGARRRDPAARRRQGRGGGAARRADLAGPAAIPALARSAPSSATSIRSGCASGAARAWRPWPGSSPPCTGRPLLVAVAVWTAVLALTRYSSLGGMVSAARRAGRGRSVRPVRSRHPVPRLRLARPVEAPRQYRPPRQRHRAEGRQSAA